MKYQQYLRLVLFDIDGTLITTDGIAKRTFAEVLENALGHGRVALDYDFAGKTDLRIYREIMQASNISQEGLEQRREEFFDVFFHLLEQRLNHDNVTVLPGVRLLLDALEREEAATLALLTGNMIRGAKIKLTPPALLRYFSFGAFGNDAEQRHELAEIAKARAYDKTGVVFKAKDIIIIGDTPHDIDCGKHLNVRSIAVATGGFTHDDLASHRPDYLFDDLADTDRVLDAIFA